MFRTLLEGVFYQLILILVSLTSIESPFLTSISLFLNMMCPEKCLIASLMQVLWGSLWQLALISVANFMTPFIPFQPVGWLLF